MTYLVTARKWRPQVFEDIVGQSHVTTTLRNAISTNRLSHAYIFSGPRGVGKTTMARTLAKAINCLHPVDFNPDNECELCREITEGRSVNVFEIDGASNRGVDEIRSLREAVRYGPAKGKYKVYIIDEVHMLTKEAFNALLKTLEEPPPSIVFIFATTEIHKVPLTILSRCQRFDFRRVALEEIVNRLKFIAKEEHIKIAEDALFLVAKRADGSLRDAQSIFDQVVSFCGDSVAGQDIVSMLNMVDEEMYFRAIEIIKSRDAKAGLQLVEEIVIHGYDIRDFLAGFAEHLRNLLIAATTGSAHLIESSELHRKRYLTDAKSFSDSDLLRLIKIVTETGSAIRWSQSSGSGRFALEIAVMQMIKLDQSIEIGQLLQQFDELKKKVGPGTDSYADSASLKEVPFRGTDSQSKPSKPANPALQSEQSLPSQPFHSLKAAAGLTVSPQKSPEPASVSSLQDAAPAMDDARMMLSSEEAVGKWGQLIDAARKERIAVGTMLSGTSLIDMSNNSLRIACPDDFHLDALKRNRHYILDLAEKVYGAKVKLETILANAKPARGIVVEPSREEPQHQANPPVTRAEKSESGTGGSRHPIVEALMREFGAKDVDQ